MFYLWGIYNKEGSDDEEGGKEEMSLKIVDFPSADYAETNNIDLNRLLGDYYDYLIEQLICVQLFVECYCPFMR